MFWQLCMHAYTYIYKNIIGGLNISVFIKKSPRFTPHQYFVLYAVQYVTNIKAYAVKQSCYTYVITNH